MRDIRPDLEERLNIVVNEINAATAKLALLHVQRDQLKKMLEAEGKRFLASPTSQSITQTLDALSGAISGTVLTLVIKEGLADGKPYTLGELAEFVAKSGYQFGKIGRASCRERV